MLDPHGIFTADCSVQCQGERELPITVLPLHGRLFHILKQIKLLQKTVTT